MIDMSPHVLSVLAMAAPGQGAGSTLQTFLPLVLMLGIFYFLVLRPMRTKQKTEEQFRDSLKEGDRVVTTGGIYGQLTRVTTDKSHPKYPVVQLQIADKVRIEVARASIGGYQGQEPVAKESGGLLGA